MEKERRKVQQVGESTLTVSLPKEWADTVNLEAGDEAVFEENNDGSLRLYTQEADTDEQLTCVIDADTCTARNMLSRALIGAYILGYETIIVQSDTELEQDRMNEIHDTMRQLTGISIVEKETSTVTLHNFMDVSNASIYVIIRRLYTTILHMLDSAMYALVQGREELIEDVGKMEDDVDVLYWLILRQLLSAVEDDALRSQIGIESPLHTVGNRTAIKSLEGMADCIEDIGGEVAFLLNDNIAFSREQREKLAEVTRFVHDQVEAAVEGLIKQEVDTLNQVLEHEDRFHEMKERFLQAVQEETDDIDTATTTTKIMWNLERIYGYSAFVAEIGINRVMEDESAISTLQPED